MSLARRQAAILGIWLVGFLIANPAVGVPESVFATPGEHMAGERSFWLAPFTLYTGRSFGREGESRVQWFAADGKLEHELQNAFGTGPGYIEHNGSSATIFISILNPRWRIVVPKSTEKGGPGLHLLDATLDGRTFVFSSHASEPRDKDWHVPTTIDMYTEGNRTTLGPYVGALQAYHLDESGAFAFSLPHGEVIVADRKGRVRFQETLGNWNEFVSCTDRALLVTFANQIHYYGFDGTRSSLSIPAPEGAQWIGGNRWLFETRSDSILVADCEAGRVLWRDGYGDPRIIAGTQAFAVAGPYLVFAAVVSSHRSRPDWPSVVLRAFDLENGYVHAIWDGDASPGFERRLQFFASDGKLLFLDGTGISTIDATHIRAGKDGWKTTQPNR